MPEKTCILLAISSLGFSMAHFCFSFLFAASDISGHTLSGLEVVCFLVSLPSRTCKSIRWWILWNLSMHPTILYLHQRSHNLQYVFSNITSKVVSVVLVTSMCFSGTGIDSSLGTYSVTRGSTWWRQISWERPKIKFWLHHHTTMSLDVRLKKTRLILLEAFLVLLLGLGCPRFRWMFSDPDLLQNFWLFHLRLGIMKLSPLFGVDTSFALGLLAWSSDASISSNSSMSATICLLEIYLARL